MNDTSLNNQKPRQAHWFLKTSAGLIAGFWLALALTGCFAWADRVILIRRTECNS
jgi:hypothetical protein